MHVFNSRADFDAQMKSVKKWSCFRLLFRPFAGAKGRFYSLSTFCRNCVILFSSGLSAALEGAAFSFLKEDIFP